MVTSAEPLRFVRPCDHAATSSSSSSTMTCPRSSSSKEWWTFLLCVLRQVPAVQTVQQTVEFLQVPLLDMPVIVQRQVRSSCSQGRRHLCRGADAVSLLFLTVQKTIVILQLQFIDKVFDVCCAGPSVKVPQLQNSSFERGRCPCCASLLAQVIEIITVWRLWRWDGDLGGFSPIFRTPPSCLELSASFRSPQW